MTRTGAAGLDIVPMVAGDELGETERLYREHADFVWRVAARLGVPVSDREDLVQDVFVVVHRRYVAFEGRSAITSWLFGIVRGVVWNRNRLQHRRGRHLQALAASARDGTDPGPRMEAADTLSRFTERLDAAQREVFELAEIEGLSGPEIADAIGVNVNTIYTRLRAARRAFRRFAEDELARARDEGHGRR